MWRFPFGRPSTPRPARRPQTKEAELLVLGVYPSALHVSWTLPNGSETVGALAVDDEPTVFWDGADAQQRIDDWTAAVGWQERWGRVGLAGGNGSSGRRVVEHVLAPLRVAPESTFFTDCLPTYFVKSGPGSQGERIAAVYEPFAARVGLPSSSLPRRPSEAQLVRRAVADHGPTLLRQITDSGAARVVTLGQEAADVLAVLTGTPRVVLARDEHYGRPIGVDVDHRRVEWLALTHPGNRTTSWAQRHSTWMQEVTIDGEG